MEKGGDKMAKGDTASGIAQTILYLGILYLAYRFMTNWGIISAGSTRTLNNWEALSPQEIQRIRSLTTLPINIVRRT